MPGMLLFVSLVNFSHLSFVPRPHKANPESKPSIFPIVSSLLHKAQTTSLFCTEPSIISSSKTLTLSLHRNSSMASSSSSSPPPSSPSSPFRLRLRLRKLPTVFSSSSAPSSSNSASPNGAVLKRKRPVSSVTLGVPATPSAVARDDVEDEGHGYSVYCKRGRREYMEDRYTAGDNLRGEHKMDYIETLLSLPKTKLLDLFQTNYVCSVVIGVGLMVVCQQSIGINGIGFYTVEIFVSAGLSSAKAGTIAYACMQVPFTLLGAILMDKSGRKPLGTISASGTFLGCFITEIAFFLKESTSHMKRSIETKDRMLSVLSEKINSHLRLFDSRRCFISSKFWIKSRTLLILDRMLSVLSEKINSHLRLFDSRSDRLESQNGPGLCI